MSQLLLPTIGEDTVLGLPDIRDIDICLQEWRDSTNLPRNLLSVTRLATQLARLLCRDQIDLTAAGPNIHFALNKAVEAVTRMELFNLNEMDVQGRTFHVDEQIGFYLANGTRTSLSLGFYSMLNFATEADWLFCKIFLSSLDLSLFTEMADAHLFVEALQLARMDELPSWLIPDHISVYLKIFPARRAQIFVKGIDTKLDAAAQLLLLIDIASDGSRGVTVGITRDMMAHFGKILQNAVYKILEQRLPIEVPECLRPFADSSSELDEFLKLYGIDSSRWRDREVVRKLLIESMVRNDAYTYTYRLISGWIMGEVFGFYSPEFADAYELKEWSVNNFGMDFAVVVKMFSSIDILSIKENVEINNVPKNYLTIQEDIVNWLKLHYPRLVETLAGGLIAMTRVIRCEVLEQIRPLLDGYKAYTEVNLPGGRCDIVLVPEDFEMGIFDWMGIPADGRIKVIELKLVQSLTKSPSKDHGAQMDRYISAIIDFAQGIRLDAYMLQCAPTGVKLFQVLDSDLEF